MPDKKRYEKEKKIREMYHKDSLGDMSYTDFRKALKKLGKNKVI